jgi:chromosome segregation ATPase
MSRIFESFVELVESNKGLFERAKKHNQMGMCEAIWNSRSYEVSQLKTQIEEILSGHKMMKSEATIIQQDVKLAKKKVEEVEDLLCIAQRDKNQLELEVTSLKTQLQQLDQEREREELVLKSSESEKEFLVAQVNKLENELNLETAKREELENINHSLESELGETTLSLKEQVIKSRGLADTSAQLESEKAKVIKAYKIMKEQAQELNQVKESNELLITGLQKSQRSLESERDSLKKNLAESRAQLSHILETFETFQNNLDLKTEVKGIRKRSKEVTQ